MPSISSFKYSFHGDIRIKRERMRKLIERFWRLNRTAVNPDTDMLVEYLKKITGAEILEAKSGEKYLTWRIPERWVVHHARLMRENGEIIADFKENPLYLWTHSVSFKGRISREDLLSKHIYTVPSRPYEIPYHYVNGYRYGVREWGFSLPYKIVESLKDPSYFVDISTELDNQGTLKVVDIFLPGARKETIFFMAHTCHPAQVSDGLANIAAALEVYFWLKELPQRRYSYRFLFGPEYFAAAAYLAKAPEEKIKNLTYGLYLDMLANNEPLAYQESFEGNTLIDQAIRNVLRSHQRELLSYSYRELWGNDEMFYSGPGFRIPVAGLGRLMHREYHFSSDNWENANFYHLKEATWILMRIIEVLETNAIPCLQYQGPLCLYSHGLYVDAQQNKGTYQALENIQILADGRNSILSIAEELKLDFFEVRNFFETLNKKNLCVWKR